MQAMVVFFIVLFILLTVIYTVTFFLKLADSILVPVPFISTRRRALPEIIKALELDENSVFFDLGCGNGRILKAAALSCSGVRGVGFEKGIIPYTIAKFENRKAPVDIFFKSFYSADLSQATHIYCYLYPEVMRRLLPKMRKECRKGTRIISCDFVFPNTEPIRNISLSAGKDKLSRTLYVYEI